MKKILASINEQQWREIEPYINCEFANPIPDEFIFYDPSLIFEWRLRLLGIPVWQDNF